MKQDIKNDTTEWTNNKGTHNDTWFKRLRNRKGKQAVTSFKLVMPYPVYEDESRNWTRDHFSLSKAIARGSKYLQRKYISLRKCKNYIWIGSFLPLEKGLSKKSNVMTQISFSGINLPVLTSDESTAIIHVSYYKWWNYIQNRPIW